MFLHVKTIFWFNLLRSFLHFGKFNEMTVVYAAGKRTQDNDSGK